MIQEIITYILIGSAIIYTLYSFAKVFIPSKNNTAHSCCGGCSGCSLKNDSQLRMVKFKKLQ